MIDNKDFDRETYKSEAENVKLSGNQKEILLNKMREADRPFERYDHKPEKNKIFNTTWTRAVAASLAVVLVGTACYMGFSNYEKAAERNVATSNSEGKKTNGNIFSITADAAEIENKSLIGIFTGVSGAQFLMKDFENEDSFYRNKQGKVDYFNDFELTELNVKGSNIQSVTFKSNKKSIYFVIDPNVFEAFDAEEQDELYKLYSREQSKLEKIAATGDFSDYDILDNSQYTKQEFEEHADGLYGEFCDGFTYTLKKATDKEQIINIGQVINLIIETDRTDSEIDSLMNEYCALDDEYMALRAENRRINGEFGDTSDEENKIYEKMEELNNQMIQKAVDGAVIDVTVKFIDGSTQSQKINVGYYESEEDGVYYSPSVTFSYAD